MTERTHRRDPTAPGRAVALLVLLVALASLSLPSAVDAVSSECINFRSDALCTYTTCVLDDLDDKDQESEKKRREGCKLAELPVHFEEGTTHIGSGKNKLKLAVNIFMLDDDGVACLPMLDHEAVDMFAELCMKGNVLAEEACELGNSFVGHVATAQDVRVDKDCLLRERCGEEGRKSYIECVKLVVEQGCTHIASDKSACPSYRCLDGPDRAIRNLADVCGSPDDACMNADNWNECNELVEDGCRNIAVLESCPLQFQCEDGESSAEDEGDEGEGMIAGL